MSSFFKIKEVNGAASTVMTCILAPAHFAPEPKSSPPDAAAETPAQERQVLLENTRFTRETNPKAWAIGKRGFEIVQEHLVVKP
jgi:hypothetical protein